MTTYSMKPLGCDPQRIKGMSEKYIVSHDENNYGALLGLGHVLHGAEPDLELELDLGGREDGSRRRRGPAPAGSAL